MLFEDGEILRVSPHLSMLKDSEVASEASHSKRSLRTPPKELTHQKARCRPRPTVELSGNGEEDPDIEVPEGWR